MKILNDCVALCCAVLVYSCTLIPYMWIPTTVLLSLLAFAFIDEYILLPRRTK